MKITFYFNIFFSFQIITGATSTLYSQLTNDIDKTSKYARQSIQDETSEFIDKKLELANNGPLQRIHSPVNTNGNNNEKTSLLKENYEDDNDANEKNVDNEYDNNNEDVDERRKLLETNVQLRKINWIKRHANKFAGFFDKLQSIKINDGNRPNNIEEDNRALQKRETMANGLPSNPNPSLYPGVVTKSIDFLNGFQPNSINHNLNNPQPLSVHYINNAATNSGGWGDDSTTNNYNRILNQLKNLNMNREQIARKNTNEYLYPNMNINNDDGHDGDVEKKNRNNNQRNDTNRHDNNAPSKTNTTVFDYDQCPNYLDSQNTTEILERVLQELDLIKEAKEGKSVADGTPCDITGIWNSEIIRMRFNISVNTNQTDNNLNVLVIDHIPPKTNALMNTNWTCQGSALHNRGGPFFIAAKKQHETVLANFNGICKTCGGINTIFGVWNFVHQPKDCRDLQMFVETKRDIFRKDVMHLRHLKPEKNQTVTDGLV